ncbi:hypothetical protein FIBSPDRAFT_967245 [Athelia psychrophila]|uniref:Retrotransposon gag domain-containing protein n=1 Tax=Athelia psychrophila TaxID=1759441 RepID=A0A167VXF7_9AGAM|nr:hypothetical protein FIBSPDRAFT_967245 [Fibularhizoctonia sp. CBS 109695]
MPRATVARNIPQPLQRQADPEADQVHKILGGIQGNKICEWFTTNHKHIQKLTFTQFMAEVCAEFLDSDWLKEAKQDLLVMVRGDSSFKEFIHSLEATNLKLIQMTTHLSKDHLKQQLLVGTLKSLCIRVNTAKINVTIRDYKLWKEEVRHINDMLTTIHEEFADTLKKACVSTHTTSALSKPSRKANTSSNNASTSSNNKLSAGGASSVKPPP